MKLTKSFSLTALLTLIMLCAAFFANAATAPAAPRLVQATAQATGSASTLSLAFPATTAPGDLLLVGFDFAASVSVASLGDSQGNVFTQVGSQLTTPGGARGRVYYAKSIRGGADLVTVNLTGTSAYLEIYLSEYAGANKTNPIDAQAGSAGIAGAVSSGGAVTTVAGDTIYGYCVADATCTAGPGFAPRSTLNHNLLEDTTAGNPGAYAATGSANSGWAMQMVALKPALATISVAPGALAFGNQTLGTASAPKTITITNTGSVNATISSIVSTSSIYVVSSGTLPATLAPAKSLTATVTFKPAAASAYAGWISVYSDAPTKGFSLSGTGVKGQVTPTTATLAPAALAFSTQTVGATSAPQTVTLTNTGSAPLNISSIVMSGANAGDFVQTNSCGSSLAAAASCPISIAFTPSASGARAALVTVTDNTSSGFQTLTLSGNGAGVPPTVSLSPNSLSFGSQFDMTTSSAQTVTLTNTGSSTLNISSIALSGTNPGDFAQNATCGSTVAAGAQCTLAVLFTPSASGTRNAAITVSDNATGGQQTVSLSGTGSRDVQVSWASSPTPGVAGYNVYRGTTPGGESATPVNSMPVSGTNFTDQTVTPGATYYYVVMAIASDQVTQSPASVETTATVPAS